MKHYHFNAYNLMRDLPSIVQPIFDEVACEKKSTKEIQRTR